MTVSVDLSVRIVRLAEEVRNVLSMLLVVVDRICDAPFGPVTYRRLKRPKFV
jgi:hypothetical protein